MASKLNGPLSGSDHTFWQDSQPPLKMKPVKQQPQHAKNSSTHAQPQAIPRLAIGLSLLHKGRESGLRSLSHGFLRDFQEDQHCLEGPRAVALSQHLELLW